MSAWDEPDARIHVANDGGEVRAIDRLDQLCDAKITIRHGLLRRRGRGLHGLVIGDADEVLLSTDRERGVILHAASLLRGSVYRILEMNDVTFEEPFAPKAFEITPLPGLDWVDLRRGDVGQGRAD